MPTMKAPYRHIPISAFVHEPKEPPPSIDHPLKDGLSGWLDIEIEAKSDLMIGGARRRVENGPTEVSFFETPDRVKAIPGASLRGMLRSVLEIASFGRAAFIDDTRYGLRDLSGSAKDIYRKRLAAASVKAGWLRRSDDQRVLLEPCDWAQIHVDNLAMAGVGAPGAWDSVLPVADRYAAATGGLGWTLNVGPPVHPGGAKQAYHAAAPGRAAKSGQVVFSNKTVGGRQPGRKMHEFFFFPGPSTMTTGKEVGKAWGEFLFLNTWDVGKTNVGGEERRPGWSYWSGKYRTGDAVPVFYIENAFGSIDALGTAMMFRVAHAESVHGLLDNAKRRGSEQRHNTLDGLDLPTRIFGPQLDAAEVDAFRGRVSVGTATLTALSPASTPAGTSVMLASPRGSFFPTMVTQPVAEESGAVDARVRGGAYASYTPVNSAEDLVARPELAGRKRYPSRPVISINDGPNNQKTRLMDPVGPGSVFDGRIRFHNLGKDELGALVFAVDLWAKSWGDRPDLRHRLGMGKPLGFGDVTLRIVGGRLESNQLDDGGRRWLIGVDAVQSFGEAADAFAAAMTTAIEGAAPADGVTWRQTEQVELLLATSDPSKAEGLDLTYMSLDEHGEAKGGKSQANPHPTERDRRVLKPYPRLVVGGGPAKTSTEWKAFPRSGGNYEVGDRVLLLPTEAEGEIVEIGNLNEPRPYHVRLAVGGKVSRYGETVLRRP